jgi:hypothetical protein
VKHNLQAAVKRQEREGMRDDGIYEATILQQSSMLIIAQMVEDV